MKKILLYTNDIIEIKSHEHFIEIENNYRREQKFYILMILYKNIK